MGVDQGNRASQTVLRVLQRPRVDDEESGEEFETPCPQRGKRCGAIQSEGADQDYCRLRPDRSKQLRTPSRTCHGFAYEVRGVADQRCGYPFASRRTWNATNETYCEESSADSSRATVGCTNCPRGAASPESRTTGQSTVLFQRECKSAEPSKRRSPYNDRCVRAFRRRAGSLSSLPPHARIRASREGETHEEVAAILGDSAATIRRYYAKWTEEYQSRQDILIRKIHGTDLAQAEGQASN